MPIVINRVKILFAVLILVPLAGCATLLPTSGPDVREQEGYAYLTSERAQGDMHADLFFLASDSLQGREAGTPYERLAAEYIAARLAEAGLLPGALGAGGADYLQPFAVEAIAFDTVHSHLQLLGSPAARLGADWLAFPDHAPTVMLDSAGVVFAGYGIGVPGHNDYEGLDVTRRIVVAVHGAPAGMDSVRTLSGTFAPDDFLLKWISAAQRGAAALVVIGYPEAFERWDDYATLARGRSVRLPDDEDYIPVMPYVFTSEDYGPQLLEALGVPDVVTAFDQPPASHETDRFLNLHLLLRREPAVSHNVVGYLPGSGAANEFLALTAHYDHLGTQNGEVFNGADDNASGVVAVLAAARALAADARTDASAERSLLFVFHGAEEKGLLGARYFTEHPDTSVLESMARLVVGINMDMVGREHPDSLYVVGANRMSTELGSLVQSVNRSAGEGGPLFALDPVFDDPDDPERIFERSDHYRYAVHGVPVVFFSDGMGANWRKNSGDDDYHEVTDVPEKIDLDKVGRVALLVYHLVHEAGQSERVFPIDGQIPQDAP